MFTDPSVKITQTVAMSLFAARDICMDMSRSGWWMPLLFHGAMTNTEPC